VYILKDLATDELLKVGKANSIATRFGEYAAKGRRLGIDVGADVIEISGARATTIESQIRAFLKKQGHELPWDRSRN
jgi:hypothetical protein